MKPQVVDGVALVAAAVQAAIQAGAPRRTVVVVAAAVAGTSLSAAARPTLSATRAREPPLDPQSAAEDTGDPAQLLASLRASRRMQRLRKKQRRREAKRLPEAFLDPPEINKGAFLDPPEINTWASFEGKLLVQNSEAYARAPSTAVPLIAESAAASPGNTDTKNCEKQHHGGHGGDMPCVAARGSQDAEDEVMNEVSNGELQAEVSKVLLGSDLEQTSLREIRANLELRLGLQPGGLEARRDLIKQLVAVELKKTHSRPASVRSG